jgi:hypothetical protein
VISKIWSSKIRIRLQEFAALTCKANFGEAWQDDLERKLRLRVRFPDIIRPSI